MTATATAPPRRRVEELQTLYQLKPHFRDVIVEGRDDAALIRWYLSEHGVDHVKVFAVDDRADVPRELVQAVHPEVNARGRVVALADSANKWALSQPSVTCVIDADFDFIEGVHRQGCLLTTEYPAMEVYSLRPRPLSKFLVAAAKSEVSAEDLMSLLSPAWAVIYALRFVLHRHEEGASLSKRFAESCIDDAGQIVANVASLVSQVSPSLSKARIVDLLALHSEYLAKIPNPSLQGIRGHDAAPLVIRFLRLKNDLAQPDHVERLLRQSLELRDLDETDLFPKLLRRVSSPST